MGMPDSPITEQIKNIVIETWGRFSKIPKLI
jgi:hypothetical protein